MNSRSLKRNLTGLKIEQYALVKRKPTYWNIFSVAGIPPIAPPSPGCPDPFQDSCPPQNPATLGECLPRGGIREPAPGRGCRPFWRVRAMPHHHWTFLISPWEWYIFHFFLLTNWVSIAFEGTQKSPEWSSTSPSSPLGYLTPVLANPRTLSWEPSHTSQLPLLWHGCSAPVIPQPHRPGNYWLSMALAKALDLSILASLGKSSGF